MVRTLMQMLALVGLLLMPAGMAASPALASDPAVEAGMEHCGDMHSDKAQPEMRDHCAVCSALAPMASPIAGPPMMPKAPARIALAMPFDGIIPEIATPPPKLG